MKNEEISMESHLKQFRAPLYSTIGLENFLQKHDCFKSEESIIDIGCGCGAVVNYMAGKHQDVTFYGIDYNQHLIQTGQAIAENEKMPNLSLYSGDLFNLSHSIAEKEMKRVGGIYCVHALCCFKNIEPVIDALTEPDPDWIAFNSLFYDGPLDVLIHIRDHGNPDLHDDNPDGDFNIFSLEHTRKYFSKKKYDCFIFEKFEIPENLSKPAGGARGTYTAKTEFGERTQFSGPVHLPWYFVLAKKKAF